VRTFKKHLEGKSMCWTFQRYFIVKSFIFGQAWWFMPVFSATQEVELGGSCFEAILGRVNTRPYLKK
jgi:hypothetical protein